MRVVVLASGAFAVPTLEWLIKSGHEIPLLISQPPRGSGRGRMTTPTPASQFAKDSAIPFVDIENVNTPDFVERVRAVDARVMLVIAFGQKLGAEFLAASPGGAINLHASLLPRLRGAAPINWAIARGDTQTGCTVFQIVNRMDAGPILAMDLTEIGQEETAGELHDRLACLGVQTVQSALKQFEGRLNPAGTNQDEALATLAPKLKKSDGLLDFSQDARGLIRLIRGMTPWPGATACMLTARQKIPMTILKARSAGTPSGTLPPGSLNELFQVATSDGLLEMMEVQPAGGRPMRWRDFLNGRRIAPGDRFEVTSS